MGSPAAPRLSWCASSHAVAWEFSSLVLPPTETKCVVLTMGVNALTVDAASLLSAFAVNSQVSNCARFRVRTTGSSPPNQFPPGKGLLLSYFSVHMGNLSQGVKLLRQ